jgi:hypothetical protein
MCQEAPRSGRQVRAKLEETGEGVRREGVHVLGGHFHALGGDGLQKLGPIPILLPYRLFELGLHLGLCHLSEGGCGAVPSRGLAEDLVH